ncbi:MAG: hypothetical protein ACREH6_15250 [Geminicoccaceae bacterium]
MRGPEHRRWLAVFAVLALAFGTTTTQRMAAADMSANMAAVAAASDTSPSHACSDCNNAAHHEMPSTACFAFCNGSVAVLPAPVPLEVGAAQRAIPRTIPSVLERNAPPEPYPPRPAVLS